MTLVIAYFKDPFHPEASLMKEFLRWQGIMYDMMHDPKLVMKSSGGKGTPCVIDPSGVVAVGFFALVDWLRKEGRVLI